MSPTTKEKAPASELCGDEASLYERHHRALLRLVARDVDAPRAVIEDACQFAWLQLIRTQPGRESVLGWLRVVARREALHLLRKGRASVSLEDLSRGNDEPDGDEPAKLATGDDLIETQLEAREALALLRELRPRERRYMELFLAGYTYQEICGLAGASYTNVNKHLTRARSRIRALASEGGELPGGGA